ncbi:hypothetical protein L0156_20255 [bacterium]|nr:hypothetical protein [bacterium]
MQKITHSLTALPGTALCISAGDVLLDDIDPVTRLHRPGLSKTLVFKTLGWLAADSQCTRHPYASVPAGSPGRLEIGKHEFFVWF